MNSEKITRSLDTFTDPRLDINKQQPDLFRSIPTRIGITREQTEGFPNGAVDGWRDIESPDFHEVIDNGEPLVSISNLTPPFFTTGDYNAKLMQSGYTQPLDGSTTAQYVRTGVARQLCKAQKLLPTNYRLIVFDAWRSLETQYATYEMCYQSLIDKLVNRSVLAGNQQLTNEAAVVISKEAQKFISLPSPLPGQMNQNDANRAHAQKIPSPHNTGGSVDLGIAKIDDAWLDHLEHLELIAAAEINPFSLKKTLIGFEIDKLYRNHAKGLDFGTEFDFAGQQSALTFCETDGSLGKTARNNRRMLYNVMTQAGFEPYAEEWWHFNSGNQMAAMTQYRRTGVKNPAIYGNISLTIDQQKHEHIHSELLRFIMELSDKNTVPDNIPKSLLLYGITPEVARYLVDNLDGLRESKGFLPSWDMKYRGDFTPSFVAAVRNAQS